MDSGVEQFRLLAGAIHQLTPHRRLDHHDGSGKPQQNDLQPHDHSQSFSEKLITPCFRNLKSKLVIQNLPSGSKEILWFGNQADQAALIKQSGFAPCHARPIDFENHAQQILHGRNPQQNYQPRTHIDIHRGILERDRHHGRKQEIQICAEQHVVRAGLQETLFLHARKVGSKLTPQEQHQPHQGRTKECDVFAFHHPAIKRVIGHVQAVGDNVIDAKNLKGQHHQRHHGHAPFFKLLT